MLNTGGSELFFRRSLGKVPDHSDALTIFSTSVSRKAKTVQRKPLGKLSERPVDEFRYSTISSRVSGLSVDSLITQLPFGCSSVGGPAFGVGVLMARRWQSSRSKRWEFKFCARLLLTTRAQPGMKRGSMKARVSSETAGVTRGEDHSATHH